jgi:hypothetical protein
MSCQDQTHRKHSYAGSRRANQLNTGCHLGWKMDAREDNSDSENRRPEERRFQAGIQSR